MDPLAPVSPFFDDYLPRLGAAAARGLVVDLACGRGRHALAAARNGARVVGCDRNAGFLRDLRARALARQLAVHGLRTDLESGLGIPFRQGSCGAILVFRFLYRPLADAIQLALRGGGLLLYETFTRAQAELPSGPSRPEYLLREGELREMFPRLEILHYWEGTRPGTHPEAIAQLAARKPAPG